MKRSALIGLVFILMVPCSVWAGDIDGIWLSPEMGSTGAAIMVRENGGKVIAVALNLAGFGEKYDTCVLSGQLMGNTISVQDFKYGYETLCGVSMSATITLTSPMTATLHINYCHPTFADYCIFPSGVSFNIQKVF